MLWCCIDMRESKCSGRQSAPVRSHLPAIASCLQWVSSADEAARALPSRPESTSSPPFWPGTSPRPPSPAAPEGRPHPRTGAPHADAQHQLLSPGQASLREALVLLVFFSPYQQTPVLGLYPSTMVGRSPQSHGRNNSIFGTCCNLKGIRRT